MPLHAKHAIYITILPPVFKVDMPDNLWIATLYYIATVLVMCIMKIFYITYHGSSYSGYEYISRYDVTYITYMQIIMKEQVSRL